LNTNIDIIRSKCINDFSFFTRYIFKKLNNKKFVLNSHHTLLFEQATKIASYQQGNTIFNIAPRYSKTEIMVKMFISWRLANNAKAKFIHLSYSDQLALDNSEEIKDIIQSDPYQELFPYVQIKRDSRAKNKWYTTLGGGVLARSSAGQVTGFGAGEVDDEDFEGDKLFGGAIIIDDPLKPEDAESEVMRNRVNNRYNTTIKNRVNSRDTPIIVIMQRLHPDDFTGFLINQEPTNWTVTSIPVINEDGSALWPFKHTIEELFELQANSSYTFNTQYLQNPEPREGYLIPISDLNLMPNQHESDLIRRVVFIDPAEKNGDYMSSIFCQLELIDNYFKCHIYDVVHSNKGFEYCAEIIHQKALDSKVDEIIFEKNGVGLATGIALKNLNKNNNYKITPYHSTENKEAKILSNYEFVKKSFTFDSNYVIFTEFKHFVKNLTNYSSEGRNNGVKDAMDVCCSASKILKVVYKKLI
jgi:hypothetical protein